MTGTEHESRQRDRLADLFADQGTAEEGAPAGAPDLPRYQRREIVEVAGTGQVTGFAVLAAVFCFLPWYTLRGIGASVSATGMETEYGPVCLVGVAAAAVLAWVERWMGSARVFVLAAAVAAAAVATLAMFFEWNQEAGMFRELIGLTAWFYLGAAATAATAWFSWQRLQDFRARAH